MSEYNDKLKIERADLWLTVFKGARPIMPFAVAVRDADDAVKAFDDRFHPVVEKEKAEKSS